jgi:hypothetical protein
MTIKKFFMFLGVLIVVQFGFPKVASGHIPCLAFQRNSTRKRFACSTVYMTEQLQRLLVEQG